jgi:hypothetical protein
MASPPDPIPLLEQLQIRLDNRGNVAADAAHILRRRRFRSRRYASRQSLVVRHRDGRMAARAIDRHLRERSR